VPYVSNTAYGALKRSLEQASGSKQGRLVTILHSKTVRSCSATLCALCVVVGDRARMCDTSRRAGMLTVKIHCLTEQKNISSWACLQMCVK